MQDCEYNWMPYMQAMGIPCQMYPMASMPEQQLESMYPRTYHLIYPEVMRCCNMLDSSCGPSYIPPREHLERMIDDIVVKVEVDVDVCIKQESNLQERQLGFAGRRLLRDLVGILFIRELLRRRRRPFFGPPFRGDVGYY